jgi:hypothetical protein
VAQLLQNFRLLNIDSLSLFADVGVSQEFNLLVVQLGGETQLSEIRLNSVREASQAFNALFEEDGLVGDDSSIGKVFFLKVVVELLDLLGLLVGAHEENLALQML